MCGKMNHSKAYNTLIIPVQETIYPDDPKKVFASEETSHLYFRINQIKILKL